MKTIVCIEDDADTLELVELVLREPSVKTYAALGAREGLQYLQTTNPDLVVLDLYMPGISGWEVYRHIRTDERLRNTPVIALTACPEEISTALGHDPSGFADYICKPFSLAQLRASVDRALGLVQ